MKNVTSEIGIFQRSLRVLHSLFCIFVFIKLDSNKKKKVNNAYEVQLITFLHYAQFYEIILYRNQIHRKFFKQLLLTNFYLSVVLEFLISSKAENF